MTNPHDAARMKALLLGVPSLASVTRGQPEQPMLLPCAAISLDEVRPASRYDDAAYASRAVVRVRLFAAAFDVLDALASAIDALAQADGWQRVNAVDSPDADIRQKTLFYSAVD